MFDQEWVNFRPLEKCVVIKLPRVDHENDRMITYFFEIRGLSWIMGNNWDDTL